MINSGAIYRVRQGGSCNVVEYKSSKKVLIEFNDNNKHKKWVSADCLRKGLIKNPFNPHVQGVGYLGVGLYKAHLNRRDTKEYTVWKSMLERCYSTKYQDKYPSYRGCTVHTDWHSFQVFADWYVNHESYGLGYHLDKDLLVEGNKVYSASTCTLLPREINNLVLTPYSKKSSLPLGLTITRSGNYCVRIGGEKGRILVGTYSSVEEATEAQVQARAIRTKEIALKWKGRIELSAYEALIR